MTYFRLETILANYRLTPDIDYLAALRLSITLAIDTYPIIIFRYISNKIIDLCIFFI